jgi:hypothetical protein
VFRPGPVPWVTTLRAQHGGPISEPELLDALDALLVTTAMQRRLDVAAAEAAERDANAPALREEHERCVEEASRRQQERLRISAAN